MKRKHLGALLALVAALALCMGLVGCGGGSSSSSSSSAADPKAEFVGTWDLVSLTSGGETTDAQTLAQMKEMGLDIFINLNEDGTAALVIFGAPVECTWDLDGTTGIKLTSEGQDLPLTYANSQLTMAQEADVMVFEKGETRATPTAAPSSESTEQMMSNFAAAGAATAATVSSAADFPGTWNAVGMKSEGENVDEESMNLIRGMGMDIFINLNEDGTFDLFLIAADIQGTWTANGDTEITLTVDGQTLGTCAVADSKFTLDLDAATSITFGKIADKKAIPADADIQTTMQNFSSSLGGLINSAR